jgi:uncharacterized protein (DUF1684 family)
MRVRILAHLCLLFVAMLLAAAGQGNRAYRDQIQQWRADYEAGLKQANSWLSLAGLFWLKEGFNRFGTGSANDIVLPRGSAPEIAGTFIFQDGKARLRLKEGVPALLNGEPLRTEAPRALARLLSQPSEIPLKPDITGKPDRITLGRLSMTLIQRGARYGIRLWDNSGVWRRDFRGTRWFPVDESYRVTAQFVLYPQPKLIPIRNILGDTTPSQPWLRHLRNGWTRAPSRAPARRQSIVLHV